MPPPPIQVFLTTIASQPALRQRQEYLLRVLQVKKVAFTSYDLASDEEAKKLWRRKAPLDKQQLPGILIGGEFPGTIQDFEDAVEFGELDAFLRLNEEWEPLEDEKPLLRAVPVGIPGAYSPAQMNPSHVSPAPSPIKTKSREGELDAGDKLGDASLHGVNVTEDDLLALVEELGLGEADAEELVKGLGGSTKPKQQPESKPQPSEGKSQPQKEEGEAKLSEDEPKSSKADKKEATESKEDVNEATPEGKKPADEKEST
ncbi:hypothetical protein PYCCODRAFT_231841 [Trametes coccinea BRFM310]|uniref:Uncharacterized protein n=1 Tax=Trametes coccinea (strain BRFM310) TaxID=1353009 RepID=A0A1Y2IR04_TRAC3|nr:hypothetical protein PYCCODRAFT_231841 [Trametes coccinea BRFM310]